MTIIACIDNSAGMSFNRRTVSRDNAVRDDILRMVGSKRLYVAKGARRFFKPFLEKSSPDYRKNIRIIEDADEFIKKHPFSMGYVLMPLKCSEESVLRARNVVLYRWNTDYPSDEKFPLDVLLGRRQYSNAKFIKTDETRILGSSHPVIDKTEYRRVR